MFFIDYTLRELFNNAIEHGNNFEKDKLVTYYLEYSSTKFFIEVKDEGKGIFLNNLNSKNEDILRCRSRGLESLKKLGVELLAKENGITAILHIIQPLTTIRRKCEMFNITLKDDILTCEVLQNLTSANTKNLFLNIKSEIETFNDYKELIIDLEQSKNIDSIGITLIVGIYKSAKAEGKHFKLIGVSAPMFHLFESLRFNEIFPIEKLESKQ
jgi:serine/threonine-protein kinase RsbW